MTTAVQDGQPAAGAASARRPPTLLCVDDEKNILNALKRLFRSERYKVLVAESGREGLEMLAAEPVDVVISDMRMPEMDGAQFLEQVARRWPQTMRVLLTGYADIESTIAAVNKGKIFQYVSKPWNEEDIKLVVRRALEAKHLEQERRRLEVLTRKQNEELKQLNENLEKMVEARTSEVQQTADMLDLAYEELKHAYAVAVEVFANLLEMREGMGGGHSRRVAQYAKQTAEALGLDEVETQDVYFAALLHDIGKITLPDTVLASPFESLSEDAKKQMMEHPLIGERALTALEPLQAAARLIRHHHERYDGLGYPDGLAGDEIPVGSRIIAIASDYDALQLGTLADGEFTEAEARTYIESHKESRYDPGVAEAFLDTVKPGENAIVSREIRLLTRDLREGMVLSRDLHHFDGMLLLRTGYEVKQAVIQKLSEFEKQAGRSYTIYVVRESDE
ncbi:MAG: two-component system response regulator [Gammaproteobacteria bacterium]